MWSQSLDPGAATGKFGEVHKIGNAVDTATAFFGAAVAGVALFLPINFSWTADSSPYRMASLNNSVPRGAAIGVIVAVSVAVLVTTFSKPVAAWAVALCGAIVMDINHFAGRHVSSADTLTTQNYLDAVLAGVLLGALGAAVLRRPGPAAGFAIGGAGFFVYGDLAELLEISDDDPYSVLETPPRWLIGVAVVLLIISTLRNRSRPKEPHPPRMAVELPVTPILASMVLALVILAITEWLARQYQHAPNVSHAVEIGMAVAATVIAATAAAMLLPGRDGSGVYLAVSLVAAADAIGGDPRPGWSVAALIVPTAVGLLIGIRLPSMFLASLLIAGLTVFAMVKSAHDHRYLIAAGTATLALTAGYCCGAARPRYAPSGVLAISALYLPSIITALPHKGDDWSTNEGVDNTGMASRTALAITIGSAIGLAVLRRFRPRNRPKPDRPVEGETLADI
ncbi:hypothetical protein OG874_32035 [Nocardia sp. NBC_00565]|uniref:hypothetical protein n=1 Tax=Nocardia sp. NBC_00565 TaxID=2975993 RepID=UPI002E80C389|nr:hypothetical protein [Nocardia sp. NBC_00565]WUC01399.1 hypothetical protein OG874_32035 [Nocardia sp. NBC_00565]